MRSLGHWQNLRKVKKDFRDGSVEWVGVMNSISPGIWIRQGLSLYYGFVLYIIFMREGESPLLTFKCDLSLKNCHQSIHFSNLLQLNEVASPLFLLITSPFLLNVFFHLC
ncbi:unnamed protein product [Moneuplotes crassus]|uniref:Uncharacterized protein n=1 Tax=Euplotes crassus TaxID=5936 RepID=A0AAD2D807_EUPCR|nr:unnamed protein product [Moneuplotes crassus]